MVKMTAVESIWWFNDFRCHGTLFRRPQFDNEGLSACILRALKMQLSKEIATEVYLYYLRYQEEFGQS
jgi:hypothetical protein